MNPSYDPSKLPKGLQYMPGMDLLATRDYYLKALENDAEFDNFCKIWVKRYNIDHPNRQNPKEPLMDDVNCPRSLIRETLRQQIELIDTVIVSQRRVR